MTDGGTIESGCIAPPEVLWNWGLLCDVNNKTGGVLQKNYPDIIGMDITQLKGHFTGQERFQYLSMQIKQKFHMEISESAERKAWDQWIFLILTMESITELNNKTQGQLLGGNDLALFQSILLTSFSDWIPVIEAVKLLFIELKDRKKQMEYSEENCLYCYYVPLTTPEVSTIFAGYGINLIGNTAFLSYRAERYPQQSLSDKIASMCMQILISNDRAAEAQKVCKRLKEYRCRGYLTGMFSNDRWIGGNQKDIARLIEKESGYPVFFLEMDFWDSNNLDTLEDRIRIIAERIKLSQGYNY
ncbi:MAG: 2-hydroxyacyl-CoA dehydratase [Gracilibacteraceae bacterium]|nr:2-hydroxyacyl-CoA dehydratase [Gracilibacteraceae bacterium]